MTCYTFKERLCLQIYVTAIASKKHLKKSIYVINQMALNFSRSVHIWILPQAICKKQELLTHRDHLSSSPVFGGVRVAHLLSFCVVFCFVFFCMFCLSSSSCLCLWIVHSWLVPSGLSNVQGRHFIYICVLLYIWHIGFHDFKMADP